MLSHVDDPEVLRQEIAGSREDLATHLGVSPRAFAYPFGSADAMSREADEEIQRAGFEISFSYIPGLLPRPAAVGADNPYRLPRVPTEHGENFGAFRFALATVPVASIENGDDLAATFRPTEETYKGIERCRT